eukprot:547064-Rhodomonas_salina.1
MQADRADRVGMQGARSRVSMSGRAIGPASTTLPTLHYPIMSGRDINGSRCRKRIDRSTGAGAEEGWSGPP